MDTTKRRHEDLRRRFAAGENVSIDELPEPTQDRIKAQRAARDAARLQFETTRAEQGKNRAEDLRVAYFASGGTPSGWEKEGAAIVAADRAERTRAAAAQPASLIDPKRFLI